MSFYKGLFSALFLRLEWFGLFSLFILGTTLETKAQWTIPEINGNRKKAFGIYNEKFERERIKTTCLWETC